MTPLPLLSMQLKVASGTETIAGIQLLRTDMRQLLFDGTNATGSISVTTTWTSFKELWKASKTPNFTEDQW